jgi:hypothetical protein
MGTTSNDAPAGASRPRFWQLSTGTVLGAVIVAGFGNLLGPKAPWFIERLTAGSGQQVTFNVNSVFAGAKGELEASRWHVDREAGFAVAKPPANWLINKINPAAPMTGPSIGTVPFYRMSLSQMSPLGAAPSIKRDDIVTTEIRPAGAPHKLAFGDHASIDAVPLNFNPATSDAFLQRAITMQLGAQKAASGELPPELLDVLEQRTPEGKEQFASLRELLTAQFDGAVKANWPLPMDYSDNVTITTFKASLFRGDPVFEAVLRDRGLTLLTTSNLVSLANPELMAVSVKSASVSANNQAMLLDTSVELKKFMLDDKAHDSAELRRFVLLALVKDRIVVVVWRNLVGLGASGQDADRLREIFQSFVLLEAATP